MTTPTCHDRAEALLAALPEPEQTTQRDLYVADIAALWNRNVWGVEAARLALEALEDRCAKLANGARP